MANTHVMKKLYILFIALFLNSGCQHYFVHEMPKSGKIVYTLLAILFFIALINHLVRRNK